MSNFKFYDPLSELMSGQLGGGSITGDMTVVAPSKISQSEPPTDPTDLVNKQYVDDAISNGAFLPLVGGTLLGKVYQPMDPSAPTELVNKKYVDSVATGGGPVDVYLPLAGGTLTGPAKYASPPTTDDQLVNKQYVDGQVTALGSGPFLPLTGGALTGQVVQPSAPVAANNLVNKQYVDDTITTQISTVTSNQNSTFLPLAGGTVTGPINYASPPTANEQLANKQYVDGQVTALGSGPFLPLAGGTVTGPIVQTAPATAQNHLVTKDYVDGVATVSDATTAAKGVVQLAGDLSGVAAAPTIAAGVVTNAKLANLTGPSHLKGSNETSAAATDISLGPNLTIGGGGVLDVDSSKIPTIPVQVAQGGTGATTLTGYVKGNGTSPLTTVAKIPVQDVNGSVLTVNGSAPDANGNVATALSNVLTGLDANRPTVIPASGTMYVVSGDDPTVNGKSYISNGTNWLTINTASTSNDTRYVLKGGDTMGGDLSFPSTTKLTLDAAPVNATDAVNKQYVDTQMAGATVANATTTAPGIVQLAGDLSGTATVPKIANAVVSNQKLTPGTSGTLKGTDTTGAVADVTLGSGLTISGTTLSVDAASVPKAGSSQFGTVQFNATSGDLEPSGANSGIALVKSGAINNVKLANFSGPSRLKGSSSLSSTPDDISLGTGLTMTGTVLSVDQSTLTNVLPLSGGTMTGPIVQPADPTSDTQLANKKYVDTAIGSVGATKYLALTGGAVTGTIQSPAPTAASDLTNKEYVDNKVTALGSGPFLPLSGGVVTGVVSQAALPTANEDLANKQYVDQKVATVSGGTAASPATTTSLGTIQLGGDLAGVGSEASAPVITSAAITNNKLKPGGSGTLKGTDTAGAISDVILGPSMSMTNGNQLNAAISVLSGSNPNVTAPTDRPSTANVLYLGTDGGVWVWNGTSYVSPTGSSFKFIKSTTKYTIPLTTAPSTSLQLTDYNIAVLPGQTCRASYMIRYQTGDASYGVSFGFSGPVAGDFFFGHSYMLTTNPGIATSINAVSWAITNMTSLLGVTDTSTPSSNLGTTDDNQYATAMITVEFTNNGTASKTLVVLFNRDLSNYPNVTQRVVGGSVEYRMY
ncbi:hypothetical protein MIV091L [Invertebrate iridescent virus 3]|uniref:Uncharacterized protein 091L n=1 Tax=Invertebrate iridescent virus 3 TaxID=345201 RepID=VF396_IIV3|nr:hypothetical protein MIV091L [Invertebrate iridescent virus 3]Q196W9.1 RecName: Full=Uncharacterized protein 091L [Invertebrate iridescent virus 3]ABF82121.1 hypothetical protein MIV091L [Invertebrate iridescent virus 3]